MTNKQMNVVLDTEVIEAVKAAAAEDERPLNNFLNRHLREFFLNAPPKPIYDQEPIQKPSPRKRDTTPYKEIIDLYHETLPELKKNMALNHKRKTQIKKIHERYLEGSLAKWKNYFNFVKRDKFIMGEVPGKDGGEPFIGSLEYITREKVFLGLAEKSSVKRKK